MSISPPPPAQMSEDWGIEASPDEALVVEILMSLKHKCQTETLSMSPENLPGMAEKVIQPPRCWGIRKPRSETITKMKEPQLYLARYSPTTPFSWSGGTPSSPCGTADGGFEELSSRTEILAYASRSKVVDFTNEVYNSSSRRRSRKKKTCIELTDEESLLLKERISLRKEIAAVHVTLKEKQDENERLKRMKIDLNLQLAEKGSEIDESGGDGFLLPDLNLMPCVEEFGS